MRNYLAPQLRVAIAFAAVAVTAVVLGATVVAPAQLDSLGAPKQAKFSQVAAPREVVIVPSVQVVACPEATVASAQPRELPARSKQEI
jgi:hypothetical protein